MKVKVINNNLDDLQDKVFRPIGSVFECNEERAKYLLKNNIIEILEEQKIEALTDNEEEIKPKSKKHSKK